MASRFNRLKQDRADQCRPKKGIEKQQGIWAQNASSWLAGGIQVLVIIQVLCLNWCFCQHEELSLREN